MAGPAQECGDDLKQTAASLAAAGKSGIATCIRRTVRQVDLHTGTGDASVSADICGGRSTMSRVAACIVEDAILFIFQVPTAVVIGRIYYNVSSLTTVNYNSLSWSQSFHYQARTVDGAAIPAVTGTQIYGEPKCINSCNVTGSGLIGGSALPGRTHSATSYYSSPPGGYIWHPQAGFKFWFFNPAWITQESNSLTSTPGAHRCDDALGGLYPAGCVYGSIRPVYVPHPSLSSYRGHIHWALKYGVDNTLTRTRNQVIIDANRQKACPNGYPNPIPGYYSCDEYPFASTLEGAAVHSYGYTFNPIYPVILWSCGGVSWVPTRQPNHYGGYSVCLIPLSENVEGGSDLSSFYFTSRVLDGDEFEVRAPL